MCLSYERIVNWTIDYCCFFQVVKNHNFVTMSQLEEDKEVVEYCRKSFEYRKQLTGEQHEVILLIKKGQSDKGAPLL